ncbi:MAG: THUMP domain-containing protein [Methanobacteriota archaeon]
MPKLLVRYGEIGLKSNSVRRRFERSLMENIENGFLAAKSQCRIESERGRIYVSVDDADSATAILRKVFGIVSFSVVAEVPSDMESMKRSVVEYASPLIGDGESFAVKATRQGSHKYTSMDVAREVGGAIHDANENRGVRVDLTKPDRRIFIEVRNARAYIFASAVKGPGGLPMGSQGKVLAIIESERDNVAAWLMMRRGCKAALLAEDESPVEPLRLWDPNIRIFKSLGDSAERLAGKLKCQAIVTGGDIDHPSLLGKGEEMPLLHPLVGLSRQAISSSLKGIKSGIPPAFGA